MSLQPPVYEFVYSDYTNARLPIYDMGGAQAISSAKPAAASYLGASAYGSLILTEDEAGDYEYPMITRENGDDYPHISRIGIPPYAGGTGVAVVKKTTQSPNTYDYFTKIKDSSFKPSVKGKVITLEKNGKSCSKKTSDILTYKVIDSRVQNISPTQEQMEGVPGSKSFLFNLL